MFASTSERVMLAMALNWVTLTWWHKKLMHRNRKNLRHHTPLHLSIAKIYCYSKRYVSQNGQDQEEPKHHWHTGRSYLPAL